MKKMAPYQIGLWWTQYIRTSCPICMEAQAIIKKDGNQDLICQICHNDISWLPEPFLVQLDSQFIQLDKATLLIFSAATYEHTIADAMVAFKYNEDLSALPVLIHALRQLPKPSGYSKINSIILPMPTTAKRLKKRGFYPVLILAQYLSQHWQIPIWEGVERIDDTHTQQGLSREERLVNVKNAFILTKQPPVFRIILFDDVTTTGASLQALAESLLITDYPIDLSAYTIAHGSSRR